MVTTKQRQDRVVLLLQSTFEGPADAVDPRLAVLAAQTNGLIGVDLDEMLDAFIRQLDEVAAEQTRNKRRRLDESIAKLLGRNAAPPSTQSAGAGTDTSSGAAAAGRTVLEDKRDAQKRTLAKHYLDTCGGHAGWCLSEELRNKFLNSTTMTPAFGTRLNTLTNESMVTNKCIDTMKANPTPSKSDFEKLGELVFAQTAARVFVLFGAWSKETTDGFRWTPSALSAELEEKTKTAVSLAVRDVQGSSIAAGKGSSIGDIFNEKDIPRQNEQAPARTSVDFQKI